MLTTVLVAAAAAAGAWLALWLRRRSRNPFVAAGRLPRAAPERDRDAVLKRSFSPDRVPSGLDAVVVGSGIGGLTTAALMSLAGRRVLVLEQHDVAGGCCHTFEEKGFEFDVGIHYVGEMAEGCEMRALADQLSEGRLRWARMDDESYDRVLIGDGDERSGFDVGVDRRQLVSQLCGRFPAEAAGVREFFRVVESMRSRELLYWGLKLLPLWLAELLLRSGLLRLLSPMVRYADVGFCEFLDSIGVRSPELRSVLGYSFGDFGCPLSRSPLVMQAALLNHFQGSGAFYPVGGAGQIAFSIVPTIEAAGGAVLVRARVTDIVCDASGAAAAVRVAGPGGSLTEVRAPLVVSGAGLHNTASLLPASALRRSRIPSLSASVPAGISCVSVFVGLRVPQGAAALGLRRQNVWSFAEKDVAAACDRYLDLTVQEAVATDVPLIFASFPSLKDPTWDARVGADRLTVAIVTLARWDWFSQWQGERVKHRDKEYRQLKAALAGRMWRQVQELFPQLADLEVEVFEVGTPVTNQHYIGAQQGEMYGLDHGLLRTCASACARLRPQLGVPGLLLTGQDVASCGFCGAMTAGLLCASEALGRNLMLDLIRCVPSAATAE